MYLVFRRREPWIPVNENWRAKYFEEITQVQTEKLNDIWISTELEESLEEDLWCQAPLGFVRRLGLDFFSYT